MAVFNIFKKNLKTVSRNMNYFIILIICPIALILVSGAMLNSSNIKNLKIGLIDQDPNYDFNFGENLRNIYSYNSLADCIKAMSNTEVSLCVHVTSSNSQSNIDIYTDNTQKIITAHVKQFIMQNILEEQHSIIQETSEQINYKISVFSTSISNARKELLSTYDELDTEEQMLVKYKENLTIIRNQFNEIYWPLKNSEENITRLSRDIKNSQSALHGNITQFRQNKNEINSQIFWLKAFLSGKLSSADYKNVSDSLDSISSKLNEIDSSLSNIDSALSDPAFMQAISALDLLIPNLDSIKQNLDNLDRDLAISIERVRESKARINVLIQELDNAQKDIQIFSSSLNKKGILTNFKNAFNISEDPVSLYFPLLVAIIVTFTSVILSNTFILKQVNDSSYIRDIISPARDVSFLFANYLVNLFFILLQVLALFLIAFFWFNIDFTGNLYPIILAIFLASSVFIFLGMSLGYLIKPQSLSMLISIFLVILFFIFSDIIAISTLTSSTIKFFVDLNPFVIFGRTMFNSIIIGKNIQEIYPLLFKLGAMFILMAVAVYISKKINKEGAIQ